MPVAKERSKRTRQLMIEGFIEGMEETLNHADAHLFEITHNDLVETLKGTKRNYLKAFPNTKLGKQLKKEKENGEAI